MTDKKHQLFRQFFGALLILATSLLQAQNATGPAKAKSTFVIPTDINGLKTIIAAPTKTKPIKAAIFHCFNSGASTVK